MIEQERNRPVTPQSRQIGLPTHSSLGNDNESGDEQVLERCGLMQLGNEAEQELLKEIQEECDKLEDDQDTDLKRSHENRIADFKAEEAQRDMYMLEECPTRRNSGVSAELAETTRKQRPITPRVNKECSVNSKKAFQNVNFETSEDIQVQAKP